MGSRARENGTLLGGGVRHEVGEVRGDQGDDHRREVRRLSGEDYRREERSKSKLRDDANFVAKLRGTLRKRRGNSYQVGGEAHQ
jgi:hypothetical protein